MTKLSLIFLSFFSLSLFSQVQNDINKIEARFGGMVKKTTSTILEVVPGKEKTSIYITGHDHRNISDKKLSLSAIAQINGKEYPVELSFENDHYSASPTNSYLRKEKNYVLMLTISLPTGKEKASFNVSH